MTKIKVLGVGAAGNKAVFDAVKSGVIDVDDTVLLNSTSKDFPEDYTGKKIILSPMNVGCGKEREISKAYTVNAIKNNILEIEDIDKYSTVFIVSSVEGGTGSGSATLLAQYFNQVMVKNVHIFCFLGFEDDARGMSNTVEFFKEITDNVIVHTISNAAFLSETDGNKTRAEELANMEFINMYKVLSGQLLVPGNQNIDDTDIIKLSNTYGYTMVEYKELDKSLGDSSDYDKIIKRMIYESKSIKTDEPSATKIGLILNLKDESKEVLRDVFSVLKDTYGTPYEVFKHIQYDGKKEYIAFIISGMKLPLGAVTKVYDNYVANSKLIDKNNDKFFDSIKNMDLLEEDKRFDMIQPIRKGISADEFLSNL